MSTEAAHTVGDYESRLPDTATVTVKHKPVDGTVKRKTRGKNKPKPEGEKTTREVTVDPRVMAEAKKILSSDKRLVIVSDTEVWVVNRGSSLRPR